MVYYYLNTSKEVHKSKVKKIGGNYDQNKQT